MSNMKTINNKSVIDTKPLIKEIKNVVKNGVNLILKDFTDRHEMLEKTHSQIMKLPSVMNEMKNNVSFLADN